MLYMSNDLATTVRVSRETADILRELSFELRVRSMDQVIERLIDEYQKTHNLEASA